MEKATLSRYDSFDQLKESNAGMPEKSIVTPNHAAYKEFIDRLRKLFLDQNINIQDLRKPFVSPSK